MKMHKTTILAAAFAAALGFPAAAAPGLVGGRGTAVAPEVLAPEFSYKGRSPFLTAEESRLAGDSEVVAEKPASAESAGPLSDAEVLAAVSVQAVMASEQSVTAIVSGQMVSVGKTLTLRIRSRAAEVRVLEIDARASTVKFQYKDQIFSRSLPTVKGIR